MAKKSKDYEGEGAPLAPNDCKNLNDIPAWLRERYEDGDCDIDEPPGISDMYYKRWVELGGKPKLKDHEGLTLLGANKTEYRFTEPNPKILETFPNPQEQGRPYQVALTFSEFTSLCPKTGQPDFATVQIVYCPRQKCVETKSLKLYLFSWRNHGAFMERIATTMMNDLVGVLAPRYLHVEMDFTPRGGITLRVNAVYGEMPPPAGSTNR